MNIVPLAITLYINLMISESFLPYILQPTRVTDHSATVIDNIFSNVTDCQTVSGNLTTLISDHFIKFFIIKKKYHTNLVITILVTIQILTKKNLFMTTLSLIGLLSVIHRFLLMTILTIYMKKLLNVSILIYQRRKLLKYLKLRSKPWINVRIQKLMSYRDKLFNEMNRYPTPSNKYLYHKFRNRVVSEQRRGKKYYFQKYFEKHKTNMKMLWHGIRSIVNTSNKSQASHISKLNVNGKLISDPVKMA